MKNLDASRLLIWTQYFRLRNDKNRVLPNFQVEKVDLSEIKKVKNLVPLTRDSKFFNDNFIVDFPKVRDDETYNDQDVPTELLLDYEPNFADQIPRETNNDIFEQGICIDGIYSESMKSILWEGNFIYYQATKSAKYVPLGKETAKLL